MSKATRLLACIWWIRSVSAWLVYSVVLPAKPEYTRVLSEGYGRFLWPIGYLTIAYAFGRLWYKGKDGWWVAMFAMLVSGGLTIANLVGTVSPRLNVIWFGNEWLLRSHGASRFGMSDDSIALYILTVVLLLADPPWRWRKHAILGGAADHADT